MVVKEGPRHANPLAHPEFQVPRRCHPCVKPFTVLIGPNDSGKSSLLDALHLLGQTGKRPLKEVFVGDLDLANIVTRRDTSRSITWQLQGEAAGHLFEYDLAISATYEKVIEEQIAIDHVIAINYKNHPDPAVTSGTVSITGESDRAQVKGPLAQTLLATLAINN